MAGKDVSYNELVQYLFERRENKAFSFDEFSALLQTLRKNVDNFYGSFMIRKDCLSYRVISAPHGPLKSIQKSVSNFLANNFIHHPSSFGFQKQKDTRSNALVHIDRKYIFNVDIKDFFGSVKYEQFSAIYQGNNKILNFDKESLTLIKDLCFLREHDNQADDEQQTYNLPLGAPTSSILSNLFFHPIDHLIYDLCTDFDVKYSRYVDDLSFSSQKNIFKNDHTFTIQLTSILNKYGLRINPKKIKLFPKTKKQVVTGLIVNEGLNVDRNYIKDIRKWLYIAERYGIEKLTEKYTLDYLKKNVNKWQFPKNFLKVIKNKIAYFGYIKGYDNPSYIDLSLRIDKLIFKNTKPFISKLEFDNFAEIVFGVKYYHLNCFDSNHNFVQRIKLPEKYFLKYRWNINKVKDDFHLSDSIHYYRLVPKNEDFDFFALCLNHDDIVFYEIDIEKGINKNFTTIPRIDIAVYVKNGRAVAKGTPDSFRKVIGVVPNVSRLSDNMQSKFTPLINAAKEILKNGQLEEITELGTDTILIVRTLPDHEFGNKRDITAGELKNADEIFIVDEVFDGFSDGDFRFDSQGRIAKPLFKFGSENLPSSEPVPAYWLGSIVIRVAGKLYKLDTKKIKELPQAITLINKLLQKIIDAQNEPSGPNLPAINNALDAIRNVVQYRTTASKVDRQVQGVDLEGKAGLGPKINYYPNDVLAWKLDNEKFATLELLVEKLSDRRIQVDPIRLGNAKYLDGISKVLQTDLSQESYDRFRDYRTAPSVYIKGDIKISGSINHDDIQQQQLKNSIQTKRFKLLPIIPEDILNKAFGYIESDIYNNRGLDPEAYIQFKERYKNDREFFLQELGKKMVFCINVSIKNKLLHDTANKYREIDNIVTMLNNTNDFYRDLAEALIDIIDVTKIKSKSIISILQLQKQYFQHLNLKSLKSEHSKDVATNVVVNSIGPLTESQEIPNTNYILNPDGSVKRGNYSVRYTFSERSARQDIMKDIFQRENEERISISISNANKSSDAHSKDENNELYFDLITQKFNQERQSVNDYFDNLLQNSEVKKEPYDRRPVTKTSGGRGGLPKVK